MDLAEVERCCCVVNVSQPFSGKKPVSCSGVVLHPDTGTILCTGLPFSRFISDRSVLSSEPRLLSPHSLNNKVQIRVSFPPRDGLDSNQSSSTQPAGTKTREKEAEAELLMLVNCEEFKKAFQALFQEADQWQFHGKEEEREEDEEWVRDAQLLSWFAVIRTGLEVPCSQMESRITPWQSSSSLLKGSSVVACGSPFGSLCVDLFISTLSRGIISNLAGEDNAVILTDARCLPGTEGGGLFALDGSASRIHLVGVIVSPFGWRANEWIGLSLVCSVQAILRSVLSSMDSEDPLRGAWLQPEETSVCMAAAAHKSEGVRYPSVCFVDSGQLWGSGVAVSSRLVVTCRHVVNGKSTVTLKFHDKDRILNYSADVIFSTKPSSPYDLALVELREALPEAVIPRMSNSFTPGESVVVVGYGGLGRRCGPSLTCGVLSKAINLDYQPVMLQTTCAVQAGASGGAVVQKDSGELLGIVSSNTRDLAAMVTYPHLNFSIPVTVFQKLLEEYNQSGDVNVFRVLDTTDKEVRRVWRLQGVPSKL